MRWLNPQSGERILDIGCGDGTYNYRIALHGAHVYGFDFSQRQLTHAATYHKTPATGFFCADATHLPVQAEQFDTVMSLCVFEHLPNDRETLKEVWRVLRPDGRVLLTLDSLSIDSVDEEWRAVHRKRHAVRQFYTHQSIGTLLQECGFNLKRHRYLVSSRVDFVLIKLSYAMERMNPVIALIGRTCLVTFGRAISAVMNLFAPKDQGWTLLVEATKQASIPHSP